MGTRAGQGVGVLGEFRVAVLVGSLRQDSMCRKLACHLSETAPTGLTLTQIEIGDLPLYNEDLDFTAAGNPTPPAAWTRFRDEVRAADAVLFITPEYNRSVPAPLKNAVDVGSAFAEVNVFAGRPAAVVSLSPGRMGAFGANHHLRQSLVFLNMPTMAQPEAYLGGSYELFDADGRLDSPLVRGLLEAFMTAFHTWIADHTRALA